MQFRKRPVVVEARQLVGSAAETMAVAEWIRDNGYPWLLGNALEPDTLVPEGGGLPGDSGIYIDPATGELVIRTCEGDLRASYGDWVVQEPFATADRKFYPCKPDTFEATHEPVSASSV